ncbi:MAG: hypothetical protein FWC16_06675 [Defluviitaleaceae bacterium]|nr:hypothetical protein [Defluviitaleaceae bacterium]MCL2274595.1 hypothetical protein [Defluviitaleaceae bacterium]
MIKNFNNFTQALITAGFSMGGGGNDGIFSLIPWHWNEAPPYPTPVAWHTGDPDTDPWEWRIRVVQERNDIAYAKLFFKKSGFITREFYAYFLAVRRKGADLAYAYESGTISHAAKRIYDAIHANEKISVPDIKKQALFSSEEKSAFDRALTELQMGMYVTICGTYAKHPAVMPATLFCTTEKFFKASNTEPDVFAIAAKISPEEAAAKIKARILELNPSAQEKKVQKFIFG